jgi:hypothetical protein
MRRGTVLAGILVLVAVGLVHATPVLADSLSIGVRTNSVNLGINIGAPPRVVAVPGTPVYHVPSMPYNYFVYAGHYYLFHEGMWLSAASYNGPWTVIALERVPQPILGVPVEYYKRPPGHWKKHGPPPWAQAMGHEKKEHEKKDHEKKHGKKKGGDDD